MKHVSGPYSAVLPDSVGTSTEQIIAALRFRLLREPGGEYRFTEVHIENPELPKLRVQFLIDLMNNRTLGEVIEELAPSPGSDSRTARELRHFFSELKRLLDRPTALLRRQFAPGAMNN